MTICYIFHCIFFPIFLSIICFVFIFTVSYSLFLHSLHISPNSNEDDESSLTPILTIIDSPTTTTSTVLSTHSSHDLSPSELSPNKGTMTTFIYVKHNNIYGMFLISTCSLIHSYVYIISLSIFSIF
jgi:hypothetical protein